MAYVTRGAGVGVHDVAHVFLCNFFFLAGVGVHDVAHVCVCIALECQFVLRRAQRALCLRARR